jgi:hypothetical protein
VHKARRQRANLDHNPVKGGQAMTATTLAPPATRPATTALLGPLLRAELRSVPKQPSVSTPALTESMEAPRNNQTGTRLGDNGLPGDPAGKTAPDVLATLVQAEVPVHEARRQRTDPDDNTFKGDAR